MNHIKPPHETLILVCEKCGYKLESRSDEDPSRRLRKEIKSLAKERLGKKAVRVVYSSCLDVCPKGKITVAVLPIGRQKPATYLEVSPDESRAAEQILDLLKT